VDYISRLLTDNDALRHATNFLDVPYLEGLTLSTLSHIRKEEHDSVHGQPFRPVAYYALVSDLVYSIWNKMFCPPIMMTTILFETGGSNWAVGGETLISH